MAIGEGEKGRQSFGRPAEAQRPRLKMTTTVVVLRGEGGGALGAASHGKRLRFGRAGGEMGDRPRTEPGGVGSSI